MEGCTAHAHASAMKMTLVGPIRGVVLFCQNNKISIDNTIDLRLSLVLEQAFLSK